MLAGVFGLQLHRVTMDLRRVSMQGCLVPEPLGLLGISGGRGLALRLPLVSQSPRLTFTGPLLARASLGNPLRIVHT